MEKSNWNLIVQQFPFAVGYCFYFSEFPLHSMSLDILINNEEILTTFKAHFKWEDQTQKAS